MTKGTREHRKQARLEREEREGTSKNKKRAPRGKDAYERAKEVYERRGKEAFLDKEAELREDLVIGRNAVIELLKSEDSKTIESIYIGSGNLEGSIKVIINVAKEKGIILKEVDRKKLDSMSNATNHQGVIALVTPFRYSEVSDILNYAKRKNEAPFIVILDEIEDPHNLGSIIRSAELSGVHGIIIPKRRNVGITSTVYKCSAGAIQHMRIAKVTNINAAIDELKEAGVWVYGADIEGREYSYEVDFSGACAIVVGSEGHGISKLTLKKCDKLIKIPMKGKINSLNASVAGGIMMYEVLRGRLTK